MMEDPQDQSGAAAAQIDAPPRIDAHGLDFEYTVRTSPGGGQDWTVLVHVEGQNVRAEAPTAALAWDRAIRQALQVRLLKADGA